AKPVLGTNDILFLLIHHWARDTSTFPIENQHLALVVLYGKLSKNNSTCLSNNEDLDNKDLKDSEDKINFIENEKLNNPNYNQ
ncbi:uncharacterized protein Bfra_001039, partial [Botrytis fragariae]